MHIRLECQPDLEQILQMYEEVYDDHNFTSIVTSPVNPIETEGTNKVIISISKPDAATLCLDIVADGRMRGGAGEAVHLLNLLFALHEQTGLKLKASRY